MNDSQNNDYLQDNMESEKASLSSNPQHEVKIEVRKTKIHGCTWPLHIYQMFTWLLGTIETFYVFAEVFPYVHNVGWFVVLLLLYLILAAVLIALDSKLCLSDPTDPVVYEERLKIQQEMNSSSNTEDKPFHKKPSKYFVVDTRDYVDSDYIYVCDICLTHVQPRTKHCRE